MNQTLHLVPNHGKFGSFVVKLITTEGRKTTEFALESFFVPEKDNETLEVQRLDLAREYLFQLSDLLDLPATDWTQPTDGV